MAWPLPTCWRCSKRWIENGWLGIYQIIWQDYNSWNNTIHHGLCGLNFADWPDNTDGSNEPGEEYPTYTIGSSIGGGKFSGQYTIGRELSALAKIIKRDGLYVINNVNDGYNTLYNKLGGEFCDASEDAWYDKRERRIYGELKERIAKAYVSSAPAFWRYQQWRTASNNGDVTIKSQDGEAPIAHSELGCLEGLDPFRYCANRDHVEEVLAAAGSVGALARMVGATNAPALPRFTEMLYALLALSELGITDRQRNEGKCFGNNFAGKADPTADGLQFCENILGVDGTKLQAALNAYTLDGSVTNANPDTTPGAPAYLDSLAAAHYQKGMEVAQDTVSCNAGESPPPPAPNTDRIYVGGTADDTYTAVKHACANMMQFGLYDQMRLFGVPDVEDRFVIDARPRNGFELGGELQYKPLFEDLMSASEYQNPASRLEAYLLTEWPRRRFGAC